MTTALDYQAIDVDNHYCEPLDAFTRHLDRKFRRRGVQIVRDGKRHTAIIGDRVNRFIPNPTFDPIIVPGSLDLMFRGQVPEGVDPATDLVQPGGGGVISSSTAKAEATGCGAAW